MRLVIDTNVLVSALLNPDRTPARAIAAVADAGLTVLVDARVEAEYRDVLARPKFRAVDPSRRDALLDALLRRAERVSAPGRYEGALIDDDDRAFVELAMGGAADVLVTGNTRHFPVGAGFAVLTPGELLGRLTGG